jgi:hypothetical protein
MNVHNLVNNNDTIQRMMNEKVTIDTPAYQYFGESLKSEVDGRVE